jgi:ribonuclease HII
VAAERTPAARATPKRSVTSAPTLRFEKSLAADGARFVIGCDEVGRGAIAGPVAVGLCVVDLAKRVPKGLRDSKLLSEQKRTELRPAVAKWALWSAVGMASNAEIDEMGLTAALGLAAVRAFVDLCGSGFDCTDTVLILDGKFDYFTPATRVAGLEAVPSVRTRIKADMTCASVSGASVLAKVARDGMMIDWHDDHPDYNWVSNKGYGSPAHWAAIDSIGASPLHRHTWLRTPSLFDDLEVEVDPTGDLDVVVDAAIDAPEHRRDAIA